MSRARSVWEAGEGLEKEVVVEEGGTKEGAEAAREEEALLLLSEAPNFAFRDDGAGPFCCFELRDRGC